MLLQRYLKTIESLDPGKIYVENIRAFFRVPTFIAKVMCEMAVVDNLFLPQIGLICPGCDRIIASYNSEHEIPETIECDICEIEEKDIYEFKTKDLKRINFYKLVKEN